MHLARGAGCVHTPAPTWSCVADVFALKLFEPGSTSVSESSGGSLRVRDQPLVDLFGGRDCYVDVSHNAVALWTLHTEHLATIREVTAFYIAGHPVAQAALASVNQVVAVWRWVVVRELP